MDKFTSTIEKQRMHKGVLTSQIKTKYYINKFSVVMGFPRFTGYKQWTFGQRL